MASAESRLAAQFNPSKATIAFVMLACGWSLGQLFRDAFWMTGLLFYFPTALLLFASVVCLAIELRRRNVRAIVLLAVLAAFPTYLVLFVENQFRQQHAFENAELRIAHWNIGWQEVDREGLTPTIVDLNADLVVLSEAHDAHRRHHGFAHTLKLSTMVIMANEPIVLLRDYTQGEARIFTVVWRSPHGDLRLLVADLPSSLAAHRHPILVRLRNVLEKTEADLLVGDLNAPRRSIALSTLPDGYRHAYHAVGSGWSATWPNPLPLLAIDHTISGPRLIARKYRLEPSRLSDHRIQIYDFDVNK